METFYFLKHYNDRWKVSLNVQSPDQYASLFCPNPVAFFPTVGGGYSAVVAPLIRRIFPV